MSCEHSELLPSGATSPLCSPGEVVVSEPHNYDEIIARGQAAKVEQARRSLYKFLQLGWHVTEPNVEFEPAWHLETLCNHFQWMMEQWAGEKPRDCQNLDVNVPPGTLKSRIISVYGPAWAWLKWPSLGFLALSSTPAVAQRDAALNKKVVESVWYRETFGIDWEIRSDSDAKGLFETTAGGVRQSQGINAKVTGIRQDVILFDDPNDIKDTSEIKFAAVAQGWKAARNRLKDQRKGVRIIIQQRTGMLDLTGIVLGDKRKTITDKGWQHLCIPMHKPESTKCPCGVENCDTTLGKNDPRKVGDILQPERNTPEVLAGDKEGLGALGYECQLNQRAAEEGGNMFKEGDWRYYDELPREKNRKLLLCGKGLMSVDCTFGEGKAGEKSKRDRVAIVVVFPWKARRYVAHVWAGKAGIKKTIEKIKEIYDMFIDPMTGAHMINKILVEKKANGEAVMELMEDELSGIVPYEPKGDKRSRANACVPTVEAHNVRLLRDAGWLEDFIGELGVFPNGSHDDILDAFTQAITELAHKTSALDKMRALCDMS